MTVGTKSVDKRVAERRSGVRVATRQQPFEMLGFDEPLSHKLPIASGIRKSIGKTDGDDVVIHLEQRLN